MAENEEELKSLLVRVKEKSKGWIKTHHSKNDDHSIWSHHFMASSVFPLHGEKMETVRDFFGGCSKITTDGDCSHEIKRCLLLGRKVMTNLDSIFKSRDITLPTKAGLVKAMDVRVGL